MSDEILFESMIDGKEVKLKIVQENIDIERKCDTEYHIAYTELLDKGIVPRATLEKRMQAKGIWTKEDDKALDDLQTELIKLQLDLENAKTVDEGLVTASKMGDLRAKTLRLVEVKAAVLSNSCESLAEAVRQDAYLAFATTYAETGKPVFKDYNDFINRANEPVVKDAKTALTAKLSKSLSDSITGLPEMSYVKNVNFDEDVEESTKQSKSSSVTQKKKATARKAAPRKKATTRKKTVTRKKTS